IVLLRQASSQPKSARASIRLGGGHPHEKSGVSLPFHQPHGVITTSRSEIGCSGCACQMAGWNILWSINSSTTDVSEHASTKEIRDHGANLVPKHPDTPWAMMICVITNPLLLLMIPLAECPEVGFPRDF